MLQAYTQSAAGLAVYGRTEPRIWACHEALLLPYESALCRRDASGRWYDTSAHLLWVGERTRQPDSAQVAFLVGVANPVACKIGPKATPEEVAMICSRLDPHRRPGRLTLITRLGAGNVADLLPALIDAVEAAGHPVTWLCDPMHANLVETVHGVRTRSVSAMLTELEAFCGVMRSRGAQAGGVHLEMSAEPVTECADAGLDPEAYDPRGYFNSLMDPRLNVGQAQVVLTRLAELLRG